MTNPWFKFYAGEYLSDLKILSLTAQERSCWITLLCLANQSKKGQILNLTEDRLMILAGVEGTTSGMLEKFQKLGMVRLSNGKVTVRNWEKRQMSEGYFRQIEFKKRKSNGKVTDRREENREEEKRIEEKNIPIPTYGEFQKVKLSVEEYQKLVEKFGEKNTLLLIAELDTGIASKGYKYKSHYATILNWARRKFQEHSDKKLKGKAII